ncbi:T9SS type A sorting domain-containing protein [Rhodothermus profundi]|uniref:Por secretion system C-terminal sorting domain-containing protein n=1 Tax=Rhodothermus profundi TaxID=633813 RepID=A0A1M6VBX4_9BACT|nr:T9SS type A sorting domain-containing protein [Rhodothermus profundi]SHK78806.1 Por secretion system C-terminal sorting domain-containing protein [Rhodothermus profundi]
MGWKWIRWTLTFSFFFAPSLKAQQFFTDCVRDTDNNATLTVPLDTPPLLNGKPISPGSELAAYTPEGICAGVAVWDGQQPLVLTLWGDDPLITPETKEGFAPGDTILLHLWERSLGEHVGPDNGRFEVRYASGNVFLDSGRYQPNALYKVARLVIVPERATSVDPVTEQRPAITRLRAAYPNPFQAHTTLQVELSEATRARLVVYNLMGQEVAHLLDALLPPGVYQYVWRPEGLPAGLYVVRLEAGPHRYQQVVVYIP